MQPYLDDTTRPVRVPVCVHAIRASRPVLTRVLGPRLGETFPVPAGRGSGLVIGRSTSAGLRVDDECVSREHCRVHVEADGSVRLTDLGSTNGTLLNGAPVKDAVLADGDKIQVGLQAVLRFARNDRLDEDAAEHLYQLSIRDTLTGLHNRRYFLECLERDLALARRHGIPIAVLLADVDDFSAVNDAFGRAGGDEALRGLADLLAPMQRTESLLARYGGEEFAVLLRNVDATGAEVFAERMRVAVDEARLHVGEGTVHVTVSVSVAVTTTEGVLDAEDLLHRADRYLYRSKSRGRNVVTTHRSASR